MERVGADTWKMPLADRMEGYLRLTRKFASARVNISRSSWDEAANAAQLAGSLIRSCLQAIGHFDESRRIGEDAAFKSEGIAWIFDDDKRVITVELGVLFDKKNNLYNQTFVLMLDQF